MIPLFPLRTVLFPGGILPLKIFEQRYIGMTKRCLHEGTGFGVCLITQGNEVNREGATAAPEFAGIGTMAKIRDWDMPRLGIFNVKIEGLERFMVRASHVQEDGLVVGETAPLAPEPRVPLAPSFDPLARLLDKLAQRLGPEHFSVPPGDKDASWVGYRLAELLPLPLSIKQSMLEINDSEVRLAVLARFLREQQLI